MYLIYHCLLSFINRVTISGKAKIGTMDGHFTRDQIYGHFIFFLPKSGRSNSALDLIFEGEDQLQKKRKKKGGDDLQKKRSSHVWLHVLCHFYAENCTNRAAQRVVTFFFFGDHSPCHSALAYRD